MEKKIFDLLGLARRSGNIFIGQDKVLENCRNMPLLVLVSRDCSDNVLRSIRNAVAAGKAEMIQLDTDREELGKAVGVQAAQTVALDRTGGFAKKIFSLVNRSDADE